VPRRVAHPGRDTEQSDWRDGRIRLRLARLDRLSIPAGAAISFFDFAPPATAAACQAAFALLDSPEGEKLVKKLWANTKMFKRELKKRGFQFKVSETPIIPIHVGDAFEGV